MLTARQIAEIAAEYGFDADDKIVVGNAEQANSYHGQPGTLGTWGTNWKGCLDAALLLHGYLQEESRCIRAETAAANQFRQDAYGDD